MKKKSLILRDFKKPHRQIWSEHILMQNKVGFRIRFQKYGRIRIQFSKFGRIRSELEELIPLKSNFSCSVYWPKLTLMYRISDPDPSEVHPNPQPWWFYIYGWGFSDLCPVHFIPQTCPQAKHINCFFAGLKGWAFPIWF